MNTFGYSVGQRAVGRVSDNGDLFRARREKLAVLHDYFYAATIFALFLGDIVGGPAVLFAVMGPIVALPDLPNMGAKLRVLTAPAYCAFLAFLCYHLGSAVFVSTDDAFRVLQQAAIVGACMVPFYLRFSHRDMRHFNRAFGVLSCLLALAVVVWHLQNGRLTAWKFWGQSKTVWSLLPIVLICVVTAPKHKPIFGLLLSAMFTLLLLMSGERKAFLPLIAMFLLTVNWLNPLWLISLPAIPFLITGFAALDPTGYMRRQVDSIAAIASGSEATTISSLQREWQFKYVSGLWSEHPLLGVGTRGYLPIQRQEFISAVRDPVIAPHLGIHGDLLRVMTENGLLGLSLWLTFIALAAFGALRNKRPRPGDSVMRSTREKKINVIILISMFMFIGFEAYDTIMLVLYFFMAALPLLRIDQSNFQVRQKVSWEMGPPRASARLSSPEEGKA